jgi:hypothetical protein
MVLEHDSRLESSVSFSDMGLRITPQFVRGKEPEAELPNCHNCNTGS